MADVFHVAKRESLGKRRTRRLRQAGNTPVVLYGGGGESVSLMVPNDEVSLAIRHGSRFIELEGAVQESALISDVQWDPMGSEVLHMDLTRVKADARVEVQVSLELRGEAPGTKTGGVVEQQLHRVRVECPVIAIPDKLDVPINSLELDGDIKIGELTLPEGVVVLDAPDGIIVQCVTPAEIDESEPSAVDLSAEPEVIGRKPDEEGGDDS